VRDAGVIATASSGSFVSDFQLIDDGIGNADAEALDGIYSSTFVPTNDGEYTLAVRVTSTPQATRTVVSSPGGWGRLLPVDQNVTECGAGCAAVPLSDTVSVSSDLPLPISFENVGKYPGLVRS